MKENNFRAKYGNKENNRKVEWTNNIEKQLEGLEEGSKAKIHFDSLWVT